MCGEHLKRWRSLFSSAGSSPHARGTPVEWLVVLHVVGFSISVGSDAVPICRAPIARGYAFRTVGDHPRMCGEHANVCVFMTYLQQNLLAYPEHLSMLQNPIQHWFSCFSLRQFCFCLAGCHDALQPRRHTDVQLFSPQPRTRRRYPSRIISPAMGCVVI